MYVNIKYILFDGVYEPAEDTFLLLDEIYSENVYNKQILEIGCGIISIYLAKRGAKVECVDINDKALEKYTV